ncbi:Fe-S protein assembly co-chaperone HscB [Buchnera aphidicola (Mollitrichosiphum nigrofasciatum)]|uniref:Fe-S protein assembly co-chaperone HscB n=1 Tax=Buchnera aphidicola TaxID=9 RepID=UPI0031B891A3
MNFFEYFNLQETVLIDQKVLKRKYYFLQKKYHPDFFLDKPKKIQRKILKKSKKINKIYKIFKNPLQTTQYFLSIKGYKIYDINFLKKEKKNFLITQFLLNEEISNIKIKKKIFIKKLNFLYFKYIKQMFAKIAFGKFKNSAFFLYKLFFFEKLLF